MKGHEQSGLSRRELGKGLAAAGIATLAGCAGSEEEPQAAAPAEDDVVIVDPHVHMWKNDPKYPWPESRKNPPEEDALPEPLLALMEQNGVAHTIFVHVIHYLWDCRYAADVCKKYPDKFTGVCRVNPESMTAADDLSKWVEEYNFHGVRLSPATNERGDWINNAELMDPIWKRTSELKVPMLILTGTNRLPDVSKWIDRYPDIKISIDHMASCPIDAPDELKKLTDLAKFLEVHVKISHTWRFTKEEYPFRDTWDQVKALYDAFGPQRLMWGTDWPAVENFCGYAKALALVRDEMDFLNKEDKRWILGGTAQHLWTLPPGAVG